MGRMIFFALIFSSLLAIGQPGIKPYFLFVKKTTATSATESLLMKPGIESELTRIYKIPYKPAAHDAKFQIEDFDSLDQLMTKQDFSPRRPLDAIIVFQTGNIHERVSVVPALIASNSPASMLALLELQTAAESLMKELLELYEIRRQHEINESVDKAWRQKILQIEQLTFINHSNLYQYNEGIVHRFSQFMNYDLILQRWLESEARSMVLLNAQIAEFNTERAEARDLDLSDKKSTDRIYMTTIPGIVFEHGQSELMLLESEDSAKLWKESFYLLGSQNAAVRRMAQKAFLDYFLMGVEVRKEAPFETNFNGFMYNHEVWFFRNLSNFELPEKLPPYLNRRELEKSSLKLLAELLLEVEYDVQRRMLWDSTYALLTKLKLNNRLEDPYYRPEIVLINELLTLEKDALTATEVKTIRGLVESLGGNQACFGVLSNRLN